MARVRKGKAAKAARKERLKIREDLDRLLIETFEALSPEGDLLVGIFDVPDLFAEESKFYDEVNEDSVTIKGATMIAGTDY